MMELSPPVKDWLILVKETLKPANQQDDYLSLKHG